MKAADSSIVSLAVGNTYAFRGLQHCHGSMSDVTTSYIVEIISDTIINEQTYYEFYSSKELPWEKYKNVTYYRADSSRIFEYNLRTANEDTILNFNDSVGTVYSSGESIVLKDERYLFGNYFLYVRMYSVSYASRLFLVDCFVGGICEEEIELKSALIDGALYGDTTLLSVSESNNNVPYSILYQNYPNPFNPVTTIEYSIPKTSFVNINVYNLLGEKIVTLVNEEKKEGNYKVKFNALSLSSGIYFYRIQADGFVGTKKLILLK